MRYTSKWQQKKEETPWFYNGMVSDISHIYRWFSHSNLHLVRGFPIGYIIYRLGLGDTPFGTSPRTWCSRCCCWYPVLFHWSLCPALLSWLSAATRCWNSSPHMLPAGSNGMGHVFRSCWNGAFSRKSIWANHMWMPGEVDLVWALLWICWYRSLWHKVVKHTNHLDPLTPIWCCEHRARDPILGREVPRFVNKPIIVFVSWCIW